MASNRILYKPKMQNWAQAHAEQCYLLYLMRTGIACPLGFVLIIHFSKSHLWRLPATPQHVSHNQHTISLFFLPHSPFISVLSFLSPVESAFSFFSACHCCVSASPFCLSLPLPPYMETTGKSSSYSPLTLQKGEREQRCYTYRGHKWFITALRCVHFIFLSHRVIRYLVHLM